MTGPSLGEHRAGRPRLTPAADPDRSPRDEILEAAAELFAEFGYAGTSTRAIAERVGVRQASLYHHFSGKDEILLDLLQTSVRPSLVFVEPLLAHRDPAAALYALASIDVGTLLAAPHNIGTLYLSHEVQHPRFDTFRRARSQLREAYAILAGTVAPADDGAYLGAAAMQLVELVIELRRTGQVPPGLADSTARACLRMLGLTPPQVRSAAEEGAALAERLRAERAALAGGAEAAVSRGTESP